MGVGKNVMYVNCGEKGWIGMCKVLIMREIGGK